MPRGCVVRTKPTHETFVFALLPPYHPHVPITQTIHKFKQTYTNLKTIKIKTKSFQLEKEAKVEGGEENTTITLTFVNFRPTSPSPSVLFCRYQNNQQDFKKRDRDF